MRWLSRKKKKIESLTQDGTVLRSMMYLKKRIHGKQRKDTICIALADDSGEELKIRMNIVVRSNVRVRLGDVVSVHQCQDVNYEKRVHVLPIDNSIECVTGNIFDTYLKPYFLEAYCLVRNGDLFLVRGGMKSVEFKIIETEPAEYCVVAPDTEISTERGGLSEKKLKAVLMKWGYDVVGGVRKQMAQIKELVELPLIPLRLFNSIGVKPHKGILLYGPLGSSKTLITRAVTSESRASFFCINGWQHTFPPEPGWRTLMVMQVRLAVKGE